MWGRGSPPGCDTAREESGERARTSPNSKELRKSAIDRSARASRRGVTRRSKSTTTILRGAACLALTLASGGASCPGTGDPENEESFGTTGTATDVDPSATEDATSDAPTSTSPSTTSATATSTSPTSPSTTDASDTTPDESTSSGSLYSNCLGSGAWLLRLTDRTDPYGHFTYLKLFYDPAGSGQTADETLRLDVLPDASFGALLAPRGSGSGYGHGGLADLQGTFDENCEVSIDAQVPFESDTGPFGTVDVTLEGTFTSHEEGAPAPSGSLTLSGGNIPNGPITYVFEILPP